MVPIFKNADSNDQLVAQAGSAVIMGTANKLSTSVLQKGAQGFSPAQAAEFAKTGQNLQKAQVAIAAGQLVGDVVTGWMQNETQKKFNNDRIAVMKEDQRLQQMSEEERLKFEERVAKAVNDVAKLRIYEEQLATLGVSSIEQSASIYREKIKNDSIAATRGYFIIGGIAALIFGGALYIYKKNN
jgi:phage tail tape-measure protein